MTGAFDSKAFAVRGPEYWVGEGSGARPTIGSTAEVRDLAKGGGTLAYRAAETPRIDLAKFPFVAPVATAGNLTVIRNWTAALR
jgi:hypothetical protein